MTRLALIIAAIAALAFALVVSAGPALAGHTGPLVAPDTTTYPKPGDNPNCTDLVADELLTAFDDEDKFDTGAPGTHDGQHSSITISANGLTVSFEADEGWLVVAAIIKGGNLGASVYVYEGLGGVDHDNGLTVPSDQGVSHVTLCLIEAPEETATPTPTPTPTPVVTPTPTPEGTQFGGTGTPAPSVPNTALSLTGSGSLATIFFGAVLIASLGALAYANVTAVRRRR